MSRADIEPKPDFPYYNGEPVAIGAGGWLLILAGVALGFAALVSIPAAGFPAKLIPTALFVAIPLAALALVAGRHWTALFRSVGPKQVLQMIGFGILTVLVSAAVGLVVQSVFGANPNPIIGELSTLSWPQLFLTLLPTLPQLVGEELLTILPFLALLWLAFQKLNLSRTTSVVVALVVSSLMFGAAHLPTYDWNWAQALGIIGSARVVLTLAYIWTRNLWVSAGAHIINDWSEFIFVYAISDTAAG